MSALPQDNDRSVCRHKSLSTLPGFVDTCINSGKAGTFGVEMLLIWRTGK